MTPVEEQQYHEHHSLAAAVPTATASSRGCDNTISSNSNLLQNVQHLRNKYWAVCHGQSEANVHRIISSHPDVSTVCHGLSPLGIQQAIRAGRELAATTTTTSNNRNGVIVVSSDYLRAKETAEYIAAEIQKDTNNSNKPIIAVRFDKRLRERSFGSFHGTSDTNYVKVWEIDQNDADHTKWGVESVNSVLSRTTQMIIDLEKDTLDTNDGSSASTTCTTQHTSILLIAHGDVLQILQTAFAKMDGTKHRSLPHLDTATPRELCLST